MISSGSASAPSVHSCISGQSKIALAIGLQPRHRARPHRCGTGCRPARTSRPRCVGAPNRIRPAIGLQAFAPDRLDPLDVGPRAGEDLEGLVPRLEVHRQRRAQIVEARMHLARHRPAMRPHRAVGRQQPGLRRDLVQIFGDRQRVPDRRRRRASAAAPAPRATAAAAPAARRGSSRSTGCSSKSSPAMRQSSQPRSDQEE